MSLDSFAFKVWNSLQQNFLQLLRVGKKSREPHGWRNFRVKNGKIRNISTFVGDFLYILPFLTAIAVFQLP
jgi:hypothetical protein